MTDNWGERRLAARTASRQRRGRWLGAGIIFFGAGIPFLGGFYDGFRRAPSTPLPNWAEALSLVGWIVIVVVGLWWKWRDMDEVQRLVALRSFAAFGLVAFLYHPLVVLAKPFVTIDHRGDIGWFAAIIAGGLVYLTHRIQERRQ